MSILISIIVFIVILAVLVLVHEFGHFIVAKKSGIRVDEFGFGFPPRAKKLFTKNGTDFTLNWIPFGGFVKIFGENGEEGNTSKDSFVNKSKWIQAFVLFAGPLFNILFAWVILSLMFFFGSPALYEEQYKDSMTNIHVAVVEILPDSPADEAGLLAGDQILSLQYSGQEKIKVDNAEDITALIQKEGVDPVILEVLRNDTILTFETAPSFGLYENQEAPALGVMIDTIGTLRLPIHQAFWRGLEKTWNLTENTAIFLVTMMSELLSGDTSSARSVTGPIGIVPVVGDALAVGFSFLIIITALISINLAIINLLPFPALDGGRLLFILIEAIKGSPINHKTSSWINASGFFVLILLMILITVRDISNLF